MADLSLDSVRKTYADTVVLHDISLEIAEGEFCVLVGPSGCGKSTLLRMIAGLDPVTSGRIRIGGTDVTQAAPGKRSIAMVFQSYALYPHMSVFENMSFNLKLAGASKTEITEKVTRAARILQIEPLLERLPKDLSGGQRQRVAIGRAIVREPKIFLFDEPLSNLDAALRVDMRVEIAKLKAALGATMVYVTHDQVEAMTLADKIVVLRDGRVEQIGAPLDLYHRPANQFVAGFIGSPKMNFLSIRTVTPQGDALLLALPGAGSVTVPRRGQGTPAILGVRPEHLTIVADDAPDALHGTVLVTEALGSETLLHIDLAGQTIIVKQEGTAPISRGDVVALRVPTDACHLFDSNGLALTA